MADNDLAVRQQSQLERRATFAPTSVQEAFLFANMVLVSGMAPKSYMSIWEKDPEKAKAAVVVALQFGMEVGLAPLQALQNVASINGYPSLWGDAALALVRASGLLESIQEDDFPVVKKNQAATCIVKRRGDPIEKVVTFSYQDARDAKIFDNAVWKTYPYRMCQMRARAFALRDKFSDVLKGLSIAEEAQDFPMIEGGDPYPSQPTQQKETPVVEQQQVVQAQPEEEQDEPIGAPGATEWFKKYKASGWTREDADKFLLAVFQIEKPKDSRDILKSQLPRAMRWAMTPKTASSPDPSEEKPDPPAGENPDAEPA